MATPNKATEHFDRLSDSYAKPADLLNAAYCGAVGVRLRNCLVPQLSSTVMIPVWGDAMIETGIQKGSIVTAKRHNRN